MEKPRYYKSSRVYPSGSKTKKSTKKPNSYRKSAVVPAAKKVYRKKAYKPVKKYRRHYPKREYHHSEIPRLVGFPVRPIAKLRYVARITLNASASAIATHFFSCNSLFDPDRTGTGHQPMGYDEWATYYSHYTVIGSKCTAEFTPDNNGTAATSIVMLRKQLVNSSSSTIEDLMENGMVEYRLVNNIVNGGKAREKLMETFSPKQFFGLDNIKDNRTIVGAQTNVNPADEAFFQIVVGSIDGTDDPPDINCIVTLEYICMFSEPNSLSQS